MKKHTWLFDLDGTLADTDGDIRASWKAAMADLGIACENFDRDFVAGPPLEEMAKRLFPEVYTPELGEKLRERFGFHYDHDGFPNTPEYPGVLDAVKALKSRGDDVIIATNKRYAGAKAMAAHFGWDKVFDALYTGDMHKDDAIGKLRKPALLALILKERGLAPADCTMIGDTINDFEAAKANGIRSIGVAWGYGKMAELDEADEVVDSPAKLVPGAPMH